MENTQILPGLIHPLAIEVCRILKEHQHQAFIVGGCVRDLLLKQTPKDWDITTSASPQEVLELFDKTIPTGLQHGTVTVCMGEGTENHFEVTTFRVESEYSDGRRPDEVLFVKDVTQDLARRDLTINAIAYDPISLDFVDPFGGVKDLEDHIIRAVGDPMARFQEDGLRIMRVARFAARFGYWVEDNTFTGMQKSIKTLKKVSKERVSDELSKTLMSKHSSYAVKLLRDAGALDIACPLLTSEPPLMHFIQSLDKCEGPLETRLAFLYGMCQTVSVVEELTQLKFSNKEIDRVRFLLDLLDKLGHLINMDSVSEYKQFMAFIKNQSPDPWTYTLEQFIALTEAMELGVKALLDEHRNEVVFARKEMNINGNDLLAIGMKSGPNIKKVLDECYQEILRNPDHNTGYHLIELAKEFAKNGNGP
jgi:tRNA nucleotidyltransferase (CCA-adding enzyme)